MHGKLICLVVKALMNLNYLKHIEIKAYFYIVISEQPFLFQYKFTQISGCVCGPFLSCSPSPAPDPVQRNYFVLILAYWWEHYMQALLIE